MKALYLWPDQPALSLFVLWIASVIFLWAARDPMLELLHSFGRLLADGFGGIASWCARTAQELARRSRATLLAAARLDAQGKLEREFQRIDTSFSDKVGQYSKLHRRLDDVLSKLETEYQRCGDAPPEVPGWSAAVDAIARIPAPSDPNVQKVLESIRVSSKDAEKKALAAYRQDSAKRHKTLGTMAPGWKQIRDLMSRMQGSVSKALQAARRIQSVAENYENVHQEQENAARTLNFSAARLFLISLVVLGIALGGAFVNFQLIALPMSELVPAGARVGSIPVSTVSALVIVLMETALGIFLMDMLGITDLFPKLQSIPSSRRKLILGVALGGLFFLASVESSLAVLREQIVEAESALKMSLAGEGERVVTAASGSMIPMVGQAVLGFVLPWVLALVAIPLEMLLDSGRHVLSGLVAMLLGGLGHLASILGHAAKSLTSMLLQIYDVYIGIPLRIERAIRNEPPAAAGARRRRAGAREATAP